MELWTVDTWRVKSGCDDAFIALLRSRSVGGTRIFRDLDQTGTYWVPRRWQSEDQVDNWRRAFLLDAGHLVEQEDTHLMELVEEVETA